jgi:hypothetical protein
MNGMSSKFFLAVSEFSAAALTSKIEKPAVKIINGKIKDKRKYT